MESHFNTPDPSVWLDEFFDPGRSGTPWAEDRTQYAVTDTCAYLAREMLEEYSDAR